MPYTYNENPQGATYFIVCSVFQGITLLTITLRLWSRYIQRTALQLNDYAILAALILTLANVGVLGASVTAGMGIHISTMSKEDAMSFSKLQTAISVIWSWSLFAVKVSILDMYIKLFRIPWFMRTCYIYLIIQTAWALAAFLQIMLLCRPLSYQWDKTIPGGSCGSFFASYYAAHIIIFILDFGVALMPVPVLWGLKMKPRKKLGITLMFALGLVIGVFDLIRIAWRNKVASPDITYEYALLFCFSVLEGQLGIVLACVPVMQPALRKLTNKADLVALGSVFSGKINSRASSNPLPKSNTSGNLGRRLQRLDSFDPDINTTRTLGQGQDIEMGEGNTDAADRIQVTRTWGIQH